MNTTEFRMEKNRVLKVTLSKKIKLCLRDEQGDKGDSRGGNYKKRLRDREREREKLSRKGQTEVIQAFLPPE